MAGSPSERDGPARASCFNPALAAFPTRRVPIDRVVDLLPVSHAPERIDEYRRAMQRGERFPPIAVVRFAGRFCRRRTQALQRLPPAAGDEIVVEVWTRRRWLRDQCGTIAAQDAPAVEPAVAQRVDPQARARGDRLFWDTLGHWQPHGAVARAPLRGGASTTTGGDTPRRERTQVFRAPGARVLHSPVA